MEKELLFAICDDEPEFQKRLQEKTVAYLEIHKIKYSIDVFLNGTELLNSPLTYDIVLLDVQMDGMDGMETAMKLKKRNDNTLIIFISSFVQYAPQGYESAIRYILKSQLDLYFSECMTAALRQIVFRSDTMPVPTGKRVIQVPLDSVDYLESKNRIIKLHLERNVEDEFPKEFYGKLMDYELLLKQKGFLHCHKSFMVNLQKVKRMRETVFVLKNGQTVPISRRYALNVQKQYAIYLSEKGDV